MRRNALGDEDIAVDGGARADDGVSAEDGGSGIDGHGILKGRMTFGSAERLAAAGGAGAEGHTLINFDMLPDDRRLSDDDPRAVVDEKIIADGGPGVDIDAGEIVGVFRHDARNQRHLGLVKFVGDSVDADRKKAGVGENNFIRVRSGRVALKGRLHISSQCRS